jgi:hypothetical protein
VAISEDFEHHVRTLLVHFSVSSLAYFIVPSKIWGGRIPKYISNRNAIATTFFSIRQLKMLVRLKLQLSISRVPNATH